LLTFVVIKSRTYSLYSILTTVLAKIEPLVYGSTAVNTENKQDDILQLAVKINKRIYCNYYCKYICIRPNIFSFLCKTRTGTKLTSFQNKKMTDYKLCSNTI
jgi:hypothetical protein